MLFCVSTTTTKWPISPDTCRSHSRAVLPRMPRRVLAQRHQMRSGRPESWMPRQPRKGTHTTHVDVQQGSYRGMLFWPRLTGIQNVACRQPLPKGPHHPGSQTRGFHDQGLCSAVHCTALQLQHSSPPPPSALLSRLEPQSPPAAAMGTRRLWAGTMPVASEPGPSALAGERGSHARRLRK